MELRHRRGIVVIGAAKAASTTIAGALAAHPDVAALGGEYFGFVERGDHSVSLAELQQRFEPLADRARFSFKCAAYLAATDLPAPLRATLGDIDVVAVLRNPVDRAISAWYWAILCGFAPTIDHEVGIRRLLAGEIDTVRWPHADEVLTWGEYARMLAPWAAEYGSDRLHVLDEADVAALPTTMHDLYRRLGLSDGGTPRVPVRLNPGVYSLTRLRWLSLRLPMRWREDSDGVWRSSRPAKPVPWLLDTAITALDRLALRPFATRSVDVSEELRDLLTDHYRQDQAHLVELRHSLGATADGATALTGIA